MNNNDVLLTRDVEFINKIGKDRAIHLPRQGHNIKITTGVRFHLKEQVKDEFARGISDFKVMRGMRMLFRVKTHIKVGRNEVRTVWQML